MSGLERKIETFENQLMTIDCKYSEKCSKLEAEISALDLNVIQIGSLATEIEATITATFDDINEKQEMNETRQEMLLQKIANLERENVMRESYDKRLNISVHVRVVIPGNPDSEFPGFGVFFPIPIPGLYV